METVTKKNPWLHRFALLLAIGTLLLIIDGALVSPGTQPTPAATSAHRIAATAVSLLTLGLVLWLVFKDPRPQARRLGWITLAIAVAQDSVGHAAVLSAVPRTAGIAHACLAQLFFAAVVAIAVITSPAWGRGAELVYDYGWPSMRSLAIMTPVLVLLQIALGSAFRQKALTLLPHVLGAMFVALVILLESIFVLQQFPAHRALRPAAKTLLGVAFGQVFLGITTLTLKSMADETEPAVIATVAAHVTGGAVTLATTIVLSILIRRNVQPRVEEEDIEEPAST
jgi:heme a synthase